MRKLVKAMVDRLIGPFDADLSDCLDGQIMV